MKKKKKRDNIKTKTKKRKKASRGQSLLIDFILTKLGGPSAVAAKLDVSAQTPANWRLRGRVPLDKVGEVARILKISPWGLNYTGMKSIHGEAPDWSKVVKSYGLPKKAVEQIMFLAPPQ